MGKAQPLVLAEEDLGALELLGFIGRVGGLQRHWHGQLGVTEATVMLAVWRQRVCECNERVMASCGHPLVSSKGLRHPGLRLVN